jgi:CDP-paratose 2-epimerase
MTATKGPLLITGGAGFIGSNLADRLAGEGHRVTILDSLARPGVKRNLEWLEARHRERLRVVVADIRDEAAVTAAVRDASCVFHLAAQVAVTNSMDDPAEDFEINIRGTLLLLEALRRRGGDTPLIFASTNKVYGDLADIPLVLDGEAYAPADLALRKAGVGESRPLRFHTPYGCSKGAADQYVLDYSHSFGLPTCVLRMSCIYGPRQMGTEDQGWVGHFLVQAQKGHPISIFGDGRQVRDILHVRDAVQAYVSAWQRISAVRGRAFNLGGGPANAVSLLQVIEAIETLIGRKVELSFADWRPGDQRYYVSDTAAAQRELKLPQALGWREGLADLAGWLSQESGAPVQPGWREAGAMMARAAP